jgi:hypothetical protein
MPQPPEPPVKRRLRLVRRRITAAVLATFVAAWLAVAALGKGGASSPAVTSGSPATGTATQSDDGAGGDGFGSTQSDGGPSGGADAGSSQSSGQQGGPVTTGQS